MCSTFSNVMASRSSHRPSRPLWGQAVAAELHLEPAHNKLGHDRHGKKLTSSFSVRLRSSSVGHGFPYDCGRRRSGTVFRTTAVVVAPSSSLLAKELTSSSLLAKELTSSSLLAKELTSSSLLAKELTSSSLLAKELTSSSLLAKELTSSSLLAKELTSSSPLAKELISSSAIIAGCRGP
ncbi:hypothetical protein MAPG_10692 [Magnaporthiopsis poae ATCC 64411]|uniref:Uncharacterized protein n=1 Tax=Magnaporthiopsis poae (strain ATCC 64411 / 73-15) TaxID=644358 RepID=A0A0C4ED98_MAGP6|nr:hypothetical protein MAPG_10692 [Magnaporthiopsis poae ATCC 64411]